MKINKILEDIITPDFLRLVEKWARYKGPNLSVNDGDVNVINKGVFKKVSEFPKISFKDNGVHFSDTETEKSVDLFDVTIIKNIAVCSDHYIRVLVAERFPEGCDDYYKKKVPKLFIYSIKKGKSKNDFPTFGKLKKDFESGSYMAYNSMLYNFCDIYKLSPFNDKTDRIYNYTGIEGDLECLEAIDESIEASKDIVTSNWDLYTEHKNYLNNRIKPKFKQE